MSGFPEPLQWIGDEPDPYAYDDPDNRCPYCGGGPGDECRPACHEDIDVEERE